MKRSTETTPRTSKRRHSSSRKSPTFDPESLNQDQLEQITGLKQDNYACIPTCGEDATQFSYSQLEWIVRFEPRRLRGVDFIHLDDNKIFELFGFASKAERTGNLPFSIRCRCDLIREYVYSYSNASKHREETKSLLLLHKILQDTLPGGFNDGSSCTHKSKFNCFGLTIQKLYIEAGESSVDTNYKHKISQGFGSLVRVAIRNKCCELKMKKPRLDLCVEDGVLFYGNDNSKPALILKSFDKSISACPDVHDSIYNMYSFHSPDCCKVDDNQVTCTNCEKMHKYLRRKCHVRANDEVREYVPGRNVDFTLSSPSQMIKFMDYERNKKKKMWNNAFYLSSKYNEIISTKGINVSTAQASLIFNQETEMHYKTIIDQEVDSVDQKSLISYLCKQSWENTRRAERSGKKSVRYCPIVLKFATFVRSKMGYSSYSFLSSVFNLPSNKTLNNYDTFDSGTEDGLLHETLADMGHDFETQHTNSTIPSDHEKWLRSGVLKFDEMKIKEKIVYNFHTHEIIGFEGDAYNTDVMKVELADILDDEPGDSDGEEDASGRDKPTLAKHMLVFMFILWERNGNPMKRVVARYSVGKSSGEDLMTKIKCVMNGLAARGFIVNQIACDGATENVSAMKQLATIKAKDAFPGLDKRLPQDIPSAFYHPIFPDVMVFIGGEMPHWVKKFVNAMENSSIRKEKRNMTFRGEEVSLGMVEDVWRDGLEGMNMIRTSKLTDEHFNKNAHSRMRVHLAVQVLSLSVHEMITSYCRGNPERSKRYSSILLIIEKINTVVDIWNHPSSKTFKCEPNGSRYEPIDKSEHEYIKYLEEVLMLFQEWHNETKKAKEPFKFMPKTLFDSFAHLVYGMKGVASQIPSGCSMVQCRGGTDDVEQEFSPNPTLGDMRGQIARGTGVRASDFAKNTKNNTSGDRRVFYKELKCAKMKKDRKL